MEFVVPPLGGSFEPPKAELQAIFHAPLQLVRGPAFSGPNKNRLKAELKLNAELQTSVGRSTPIDTECQLCISVAHPLGIWLPFWRG
jgi:hypothetical protein